MRAEYNSDVHLNDIYLDVEDKCYMCEHSDICPLLGAVETNAVYLASNTMEIRECEMFTQYRLN